MAADKCEKPIALAEYNLYCVVEISIPFLQRDSAAAGKLLWKENGGVIKAHCIQSTEINRNDTTKRPYPTRYDPY